MTKIAVVAECRLPAELVAEALSRDLREEVATVVLGSGAAPGQPVEALAAAELVVYVPERPIEAVPWAEGRIGAGRALIVVDLNGQIGVGQALRLGARGYVGPEEPRAALARRAVQAARGELAVPADRMAELQNAIAQVTGQGRGIGRLTGTQRQITQWIAQGLTAAEIGVELGISESAARGRIRRIVDRLGVANEQELAALAAMAGLYPGPKQD